MICTSVNGLQQYQLTCANFTANCCTSTKAGIVFKCIIMRSTKSSLSLFGTLKSKYMFFIISFFHCFIREVRWPSGTGLGKNWAPKMLWARILFREFLANIFLSIVHLFLVNIFALINKYCCLAEWKLNTSVRCRQVTVVKITAWQMYWTWFTSLCHTRLSGVKSTSGVQLGLEHV